MGGYGESPRAEKKGSTDLATDETEREREREQGRRWGRTENVRDILCALKGKRKEQSSERERESQLTGKG